MGAKYLVSACLAGVNCKYNGANNLDDCIVELVKKGDCVLICPEQLGGCTTPRIPCEISSGTGVDVLDGTSKVITKDGVDVTNALIKGAEETLKIAQLYNIDTAILKARSPSCGCGSIYDGSFKGQCISGDGVTAALLKRHGIQVITEEQLCDNVISK